MFGLQSRTHGKVALSIVAAGLVTVSIASFHSADAEPAPQVSVLSLLLEPFSVEIPAGIADSGGGGTSNPQIVIDSDGNSGSFIVNSVLIRTDVPSTGFQALSINSVNLNGTTFDTRTQNVVGFTDGSGVMNSADLMGTPIRVQSLALDEYFPGGNFPHQLTASSAGNDDIRIRFFARSDDSDLEVETIRVSGLKRLGDNITVTYVPGS